jgi:plastocyanin
MKSWTLATIWVMATLVTPPVVLPADADQDQDSNKKLSVTVSFGAGLNTAQPGNAANHHILPATIKVKTGGVVNFVVAGFHQIFVYNPGKAPEDIVVPASGLFINDLTGLYYRGLDPAAPPPAGLSNAQNRVESVSFSEPGTYLVICNVRPHFLDGMFAFVQVSDSEEDDK